jgi:hypothetical protein
MSSKEDRPLDELTFKACQQALDSAFAVPRQWYRETDPQLKAKTHASSFLAEGTNDASRREFVSMTGAHRSPKTMESCPP